MQSACPEICHPQPIEHYYMYFTLSHKGLEIVKRVIEHEMWV